MRHHEPVAALRVELWAQRGARSEPLLLGAAQTLEGGVFGIVHAEQQADPSLRRFRLVVREADGDEVKNVEGPTSWDADNPPGRIILYAQVDQGHQRECATVPTLRRSYLTLQGYPDGTRGTLWISDSTEYAGELARIVGTIRDATGRALPNVRLRLTARPVGRSTTAPSVGDYPNQTREIELARTYTHASAAPEDIGTYEIIWPLELPTTSGWRGQGWFGPGPASTAWNVDALTPPYLLILRVEAPQGLENIDLDLGPDFDRSYVEVSSRTIQVRVPGEPKLRVEDFLLDRLSLPDGTEFANLSEVLEPFEHAFFRGVGSSAEGSVNADFDAADLMVLAEGVGRDADQVAAWLLAQKLSYELAGAANRSKNVLRSATALAIHQEILSAEVCYGIVRASGRGATQTVLAMPLAEVREHLCLAIHRRQIAARSESQLDQILELLWHAGAGAQLLNGHSTTIAAGDFRENSLLAVLGASGLTPLATVSSTSNVAESRLLALHRAALLVEQLRRGELDGAPLPDATLWSTDPSSPPFDNVDPLNNSVWNLVRNGIGFDGEPLDSHDDFGAETAFFERCAANALLGRLMFQVSVALHNFWGTATAAHDLAEMAVGAIEALATSTPAATLPDAFVDDGTPDPAAWAEQVLRRAKRAWWSRGLRGMFQSAGGALSTFEASLPDDVNLRRARLRASDMPGADDETKRANLREVLRQLRRAKLAEPGEEDDVSQALTSAGVSTSAQIARMGRKRFFTAMGSSPHSKAVHARATFTAAAASTLYANRHPNAQAVGVAATSPLHVEPVEGDDDWDLHEVTFEGASHGSGLTGYAAYEPWQTIFSPLAYLAELLRWIDQRGGLNGSGNLADRRPDIPYIHLSHANTFGVVPTLTLALEVLEVAAIHRFDPSYEPFGDPLQTRLRDAHGSDTASYLYARAYEGSPSLANAPWPIGAPFALAAARIAAALPVVGIERWQLMRDLRNPSTNAPTLAVIDGAVLGLPQATIDAFGLAIDDTAEASKAWAGLEAADTGLDTLVATFMLHFGVSIEQVRALVRHRGIHPPSATQRPLSHTSAAWSFDDLEFAAAWSLEEVQRVTRVLRLAQATGWSVYETDLAARPCLVDGATPVDLSHADLAKVAGVRAVQLQTGLSLDRLHGWWADLDTFGSSDDATSPYAQRFVRSLPAELTPTSDTAAPHGLQLTADRTEVVAVSNVESFDDLRDAIRGALAIDGSTVERLVATINATEDTPADPPMSLGVTLARLSGIARWVDLASWLDLPVDRLLDLALLLEDGADPFASPWTTHDLLEALDRAKEIGLPPSTLADLLVPEGIDALPSKARATLVNRLAELWHALRETRRDLLRVDARPEAESWEERVRLVLIEVIDAEDLDTVVDNLQTSGSYPAVGNGLDAIAQELGDDGFDESEVQVAISAEENTPEARTPVLVDAVRDALYVRRARAVVVEAFRAGLGDGDDLGPWAARQTPLVEDGTSLQAILLDPSFPGEVSIDDPAPDSLLDAWAPDSATLDGLLAAWRGVERVVHVARACGLSTDTLDWLEADRAAQGFARPAELLDRPDPPNPESDLLTRLLTTVAWAEAERRLPRSGPSITQIHDAPDEATYEALLATRLGVSVTDVDAMATAIGVTLDGPGIASAHTFIRLARAARHLRRLGAGPAAITAWRSGSPSLDDASAVVEAARLSVGAARWTRANKDIEGRLWRARRDALVAVLSIDPTSGEVRTPDALYEHLLMDPLVEACGQTSRVRDAIGATQQYIQRWMLRLEPQAPALTEDDRADWRWMKTYRVWEAARRVFLYPENWLRPELRRDTTPEFERLASALGSADLTEDEVERAYLGYLQELHEIGSLEVVSHYDEELAGTTTSGADLHVIGRTASNPPRYFYRARVEGRWQPWESLDLGIEGVHVMIARHLGRLMVLWPTFAPKPLTKGSGENAKQVPRTEITWHWSVKGANGWLKPESSRENDLHMEHQSFEDGDYRRVQFRVEAQTGQGSPLLRVRLLEEVAYDADWLEPQPTSWQWNSVTDALELRPPSNEVTITVENIRDHRRSPVPHNPTGARRMSDGTLKVGPEAPDGSLISSLSHLARVTKSSFTLHTPPQVWNFAVNAPFFVSKAARTYLVTPLGEADVRPIPLMSLGLEDANFSLGSEDFASGGDTQGPNQSEGSGAKFSNATEPMYDGQSQTASTMSDLPPPELDAELFYHPHTGWLIERIRTFGLIRCLTGGESEPALDGLHHQTLDESITSPELGEKTRFEYHLLPVPGVFTAYPTERFAFEASHPLAPYNWELFFHIPMLIASRYRQSGDYDSALRWYQTIFDPTVGDPARIWRFGPFAVEPGAVEAEQFQALVDGDDADPRVSGDLRAAIAHWMQDPFDAHRAASVRSGAYRRWVVREYLETLIAWGDELFTRYTAETVAEARQLYVVAGGLLGRRPIALPPPPHDEDATVATLLDDDALGADLGYEMAETWVSLSPPAMGLVDGLPTALPGTSSFFGIPFNDHLLRLWDTVADRLFKIRNCLNIDGEAVPLALFDPPIDPAALVGAAGGAAGLAGALRALGNPLPHHRFSVTHQRAEKVTGSVKALGAALLSALEKRDSEALGRLRAEHEVAMQDRMIEIRRMQVTEAEKAKEGVEASKELTEQRKEYYEGLTEAGYTTLEKGQVTAIAMQAKLRPVLGTMTAGVQLLGLIPSMAAGVMLGPFFNTTVGPKQFRAAGDAAVQLAESGGALAGVLGQLAGTFAAWERRKQEWDQQVEAATRELKQLDAQLEAAQTRIEIAQRELSNAQLAREHSATSLAFMREKFTNTELYHWMAQQLTSLYSDTWRLAFDLAMRAEACFRLETAQPTAGFIRPDAWDASRRGLLAGEKLGHDLERMDIAYAEQDRREYELTKVIALSEVDGVALERLRQDGFCFFYLPEVLFDQDGPGHYLRRIRQVTVSIPCVAGPSAMVHGKLTLLQSKTRRVADRTVEPVVDSRKPESIVTSRGQDDSGTFGGQDGRYQPFEYRGVADSVWKLELLDRDMPTFDHLGITDASLTIGFTARDGGEVVASAVRSDLAAALNEPGAGFADSVDFASDPMPLDEQPLLAFAAQRHAPDAWFRFAHPEPDDEEQLLEIDLATAPWPIAHARAGVAVKSVEVVFVTNEVSPGLDPGATVDLDIDAPAHELEVDLSVPAEAESARWRNQPRGLGAVEDTEPGEFVTLGTADSQLVLRLSDAQIAKFTGLTTTSTGGKTHFKPGALQDIVLILRYTLPTS